MRDTTIQIRHSMSCFSGGMKGSKKQQLVTCSIELLDDTIHTVKVKTQSKGQTLMDSVCSRLNLVENDYFGLRILDECKNSHWLDLQKGFHKQMKRYGLSMNPARLYFGVKFYATDPCTLKEEVTRYQFFLQLKKDVLYGRIPASFDTLVELCSLVVQSELGDHDVDTHTEGYVSELRLAPQQSEDLEQAIQSSHQKLIGYHPSACEYMYLDKIKWQDMYGVDLHLVKGAKNAEYYIGLTPSGVVIYRQKTKVSVYYWPRITGITFKARKFSLKVKDKNGVETSYYFTFDQKEACKDLWKCCIEHHAFFRLTQVESTEPKVLNTIFQLGSKFRYSGRTEKEMTASEAARSPQAVRRTKSQRQERRRASSVAAAAENQQNQSAPSPTVSNRSKAYTAEPYSHAPVKVTRNGSVASSHHRSIAGSVRKHHPTSSIHNTPRDHNSSQQQLSDNINGYLVSDSYLLNTSNISHGTPIGTSTDLDLSLLSQGGLFTSGRDSPKSVRSEKLKFPQSKLHRNDSGSEADSVYSRRRVADSPDDGKSLRKLPDTNGYGRRESDNESDRSGMSRRRRRRYHQHRTSNDSGGSDIESLHRYRRHSGHSRHKHHQHNEPSIQQPILNNESFYEGSVCSGVSTPRSEMLYSQSRKRHREAPNGRNFSEDLIRHFQQKLMETQTQSLSEKHEQENGYNSMSAPSDENDRISPSQTYDDLPSSSPPYRSRPPRDKRLNEMKANDMTCDSSRRPSGSYENVTYDRTGSAHISPNMKSGNPSKTRPLHCNENVPKSEAQSGSHDKLNSAVINSQSDCAAEFTLDKKLAHLEEMRRLTSKITSMTQSPKRYFPDLYCNENAAAQSNNNPQMGTQSIQSTHNKERNGTSYFPDFKPVEHSNPQNGARINGNSIPAAGNRTSFVRPADIYKHTDHLSTPPKVIDTLQAPSNQQRQYSPALHIYRQRNDLLNQSNHSHNSTASCTSPSPGKANGHVLEESFYSQYTRKLNSSNKHLAAKEYKIINGSNTTCKPLLKISNI